MTHSQSQEIASLRTAADDTHAMLRKTQQLATDRDLLLKERAREMSDMQLELSRKAEEVERLRQEDTSLGGEYESGGGCRDDNLIVIHHIAYIFCFSSTYLNRTFLKAHYLHPFYLPPFTSSFPLQALWMQNAKHASSSVKRLNKKTGNS